MAKSDIAVLSYSPDGSTRCEIVPGGCIWGPPLWGKGRSYEVSNGTSRKCDGVSYKLSTVTTVLSPFGRNLPPVERNSPTLKSTGVGHFGATFGEEGVDQCKPNFNIALSPFGHSLPLNVSAVEDWSLWGNFRGRMGLPM